MWTRRVEEEMGAYPRSSFVVSVVPLCTGRHRDQFFVPRAGGHALTPAAGTQTKEAREEEIAGLPQNPPPS